MSVVVVTGAGGYIGGALTQRLEVAGNTVRRFSTQDREGPASAAAWRQALEGAEALVHLSWRTSLRAAESDPQGDELMNLAPARGLVEAAAQLDAPLRVLFASSATIVGVDHVNPVNEAADDRPVTIYDRHKKRAEELLREATECGALRACSLRLANVYGAGPPSRSAGRGILNAMMARAWRGEPLTLYGDGRYIRDFIHLDDAVAAFMAALRTPAVLNGGHYVIATGQGHSLEQAYRWIADEARACGARGADIMHVAEPPDLMSIERRDFVGDASLFSRSTGWRPTMDLRSGIRHWFAQHRTPEAAGAK